MTNAKLANMAAATFKGRAASGGTGDPTDLSAAEAKTALAISAADVSGLGALATLNQVGTGQISDDAVTNAKLANMAAATFKGRTAGAGTGDPTDLTATQAKTALAISASDVSGLGALATLSQIGTGQISDDAVTYAKMQNIYGKYRANGGTPPLSPRSFQLVLREPIANTDPFVGRIRAPADKTRTRVSGVIATYRNSFG